MRKSVSFTVHTFEHKRTRNIPVTFLFCLEENGSKEETFSIIGRIEYPSKLPLIGQIKDEPLCSVVLKDNPQIKYLWDNYQNVPTKDIPNKDIQLIKNYL